MTGPVSVTARSTTTTTSLADSADFYKNQALRAALASHKPPTTPPKRLTRNGFVSSGALAAAARAGAAPYTTDRAATPAKTDVTTTVIRVASPEHRVRAASLSPHRFVMTQVTAPDFNPIRDVHLSTPAGQAVSRQTSPSQIAAARAAARSATPGGSIPQARQTSQARKDPSPERKDETPIQPTNSLVKMFEARARTGSEAGLRPITASGPSIVLSPKPVRAVSVRLTPRRDESGSKPLGTSKTLQISPSSPPSPPLRQQPKTTTANPVGKPVLSEPEHHAANLGQPLMEHNLPVPLKSSARRGSLGVRLGERPDSTRIQAGSTPNTRATSASPPRVTSSIRPAVGRSDNRLSTVPASRPLTMQLSVPEDGFRAASATRGNARATERIRPQLTADSLANAMVAGSIASSRAPSPYKPPNSSAPQPPPPRRGAKTLGGMGSLFSHSSSQSSSAQRQPSPGKPALRTTLRATPLDPEGPVMPKAGKLRKSGRALDLDTISATDRKLYEGVWAANRGILIPGEETLASPQSRQPASLARSTSARASDEVHGYVVRDIWSRSGLETSMLEHIWELVDGGENGTKRSGAGCLDRHEFVVGMWLVDQALMGRKLPAKKLSDEVWASLRIGAGLEFRR